jgi:hypothetical protein
MVFRGETQEFSIFRVARSTPFESRRRVIVRGPRLIEY